MKRSQAFQHELKPGQVNRADRPLPPASGRSRLFFLVKLAQQPLIFWGSIWIAALMLIGLALGALLSPGFVTPQPISSVAAKQNIQTTVPSEISTTLTSDQTTVSASQPVTASLWSLGAIAFSCAAGSILLAKCFDQSSKTQHFKDRVVNSSTPIQSTQPCQPASRSPVQVMSIADYQMPPALKSTPSSNRVETKLIPPATLARELIDLRGVTEAIVIVVPSEQSHPLDDDDISLANAMDIRKRHPLSFWL